MIEIIFIMVLVALCCSIVGTFLVLRGMSMMADAISHAALLGIILFFFVARDTQSPLLFFGAALAGVVTVITIELLVKTRLVANDASIGIVFPLFFSIAVILVSKYASKVHIDTDCILMGNVLWAHLNRTDFLGFNLPVAYVSMGILLLICLVLLAVFYKELKLISFDPIYAAVSGFTLWILHYGLMTLVSFVAVYAFDNVGSILVLSFMIAPPATAYFISKRLWHMIFGSIIFSTISSILGVVVAYEYNLSISGTAAAFSGLIFIIVAVCHKNGIVMKMIRKYKARQMVKMHLILMCIGDGCSPQKILDNLSELERKQLIDSLIQRGLIIKLVIEEKVAYELSPKGLELYNAMQNSSYNKA